MYVDSFDAINKKLLFLLPMIYAGNWIFNLNETVDVTEELSVQYTMVFNTFVLIQLFNEINAVKLDNGKMPTLVLLT